MPESLGIDNLIKKYPELPYAFMAFVSYTISIIFGIMEIGDTVTFYDVRFHIISTTLWAIFGLLSLYCLYTAFFDMWIYALHLIVAYYLAGMGFLAIYLFNDNINFIIFGIVLAIFSFFFIIFFIYKIGIIRSYRIFKSNNQEAARERYSLSSWYLVPFLFFGISVVSFLDLGYWYEHSGHFPIFHVIAEILLILVVIYLLWIPENVLFYGEKEVSLLPSIEIIKRNKDARYISTTPGKADAGEKITIANGEKRGERKGIIPSSMTALIRKSREPLENCPGFDSPPESRKKSCPGCYHLMDIYWCPQSEEYLINCPSCERITYFGRKVCVHCKSRLSEKITCDNCGKGYPIRKFKDAL